MATPVPFRYIRGLPAVAQKEIERNFLHVQGQIVGGVTIFDAVVNGDLATNPAAHIYKNFNDLAAYETWDASRTFNVALISGTTPATDTVAVDLAGRGHLTVTGSTTPDTQTASWHTFGICMAAGKDLRLINVAVDALGNSSMTVNLHGNNATLFTQNCAMLITSTNTVIGSWFDYGSVIWGGGLLNSGGTSGYFFLSHFKANVLSNGGQPVQMVACFVESSTVTFTGNGTTRCSGILGGNWSTAGPTYLTNYGVGGNVTCSTTNDIVVFGDWANVTFSSVNNNGAGFYFAHQFIGTAASVDMQAGTYTDAYITSTSGVGATLRGYGHTAKLHFMYGNSPSLSALGMTHSIVIVEGSRTSAVPQGYQLYTLDATSVNNILMIAADLVNTYSLASTNAGTGNLIITNAGVTPSGAAGGGLAGSYPNPTIAPDFNLSFMGMAI